MFYLAGIVIAFFLTFILISKKGKSNADLVLAAWIGTAGFQLIFYNLYISGKYVDYPFFLGIDLPIPLLHGPLLLLYTREMTGQKSGNFSYKWNFVPYLFFTALLSRFIFSPASYKIAVYQQHGAGYETLVFAISLAVMFSGVIYAGLALRLLAIHQRNIREVYSNTDKINLRWLAYLIFGIFVIWTIVIFGNDQYTYGAVVIFLFFQGYFGIKQVGIFTNSIKPASVIIDEEIRAEETEALSSNTKYARSGVNMDELNRIHEQMKIQMFENKYYKNPELTLGQLAEELQVHPNVLSQVINSLEGKSFFDYINELRVDAFKVAVSNNENQKYTLLALAFDCGFNSKTSFNRNFKKATGLAPSEYISKAKMMISA